MAISKYKKLVASLLLTILFFTAIFLPLFRKQILDILEFPFKLFHYIVNDLKALIFFHYNFLENRYLKKQILLLQKRCIQNEEILKENERLRKLLSFRENAKFKLVPAQVIMRNPDSLTSIIIIDKGKVDGIEENFAVITDGALVGRVAEVSKSSSKVVLLDEPQFCVSAIIQRSREYGLICGTLENQLIMRYLDKQADVVVGDTVITAGFTEFFPKGIIIGEVISIEENPGGISLSCRVKPAIDLYKLEEVMVIVK
ncbi:MAG: rod shape-determining protein MreC [Candidatus Omnitrophica bacterium]|nr:rod shape-determining protein MreC [Candidatus Omnitrophota bacterium]